MVLWHSTGGRRLNKTELITFFSLCKVIKYAAYTVYRIVWYKDFVYTHLGYPEWIWNLWFHLWICHLQIMSQIYADKGSFTQRNHSCLFPCRQCACVLYISLSLHLLYLFPGTYLYHRYRYREGQRMCRTHLYMLTICKTDIGKDTQKIWRCGIKLISWHEFGMTTLYRQIKNVCMIHVSLFLSLTLSHPQNVPRKESHCTSTLMTVTTKDMSPLNKLNRTLKYHSKTVVIKQHWRNVQAATIQGCDIVLESGIQGESRLQS